MRKKRIWILLAVALAAGVVLVLVGGRRRGVPKYRTAKVDRGGVTQTVTATGFLSAVTTVKIGSQVSGIIASLNADFNSRVQKGHVLAELDPTPFQARVAQNEANLEKAKVELRNTDIALRRQKSLVAQGLSPQADFDAVQANHDAARAAVSLAAASLKQARTDLGYTRIVAPIDGVVVDRQYDVGQTVAASFQAPTLFTIAQDLTQMQVSADVSESDIGKVRVSQPVRFTVDAYPEREFRGKIAQIRLNATVTQNVVTYPVIVEVNNRDLTLRPNMTANVSINVATVEDSLRVPNAALRWKPEATEEGSVEQATFRAGAERGPGGGPERVPGTRAEPGPGAPPERGPGAMARQFDRARGWPRRERFRTHTVYILPSANGQPKPVEVRTGISDGRFTQVVDGELREGSEVIIGLATARADASARNLPGGMGGPRPGGRGRF